MNTRGFTVTFPCSETHYVLPKCWLNIQTKEALMLEMFVLVLLH